MPRLTNWLNKMVKKYLAALLFLAHLCGNAQTRLLTLEETYRLSRENYPVIKQKDLIRQTEDLGLRNLNSAYLPQVNFNAQVSYQSDVTAVDVPLPGIKIPSQPKEQYKIIADVSQMLYDGGVTREQKNIQLLNSAVEDNNVEVELFALKNRINQIYFNILYQDELLKQNALLLKDIQIGIDKIKPQVDNGVVLRSNLQVLQAQYLQTEQRAIELKNTRKGLLDALSLLINQPLDENANLQLPPMQSVIDTSLNRPELKLYEAQASLIQGQKKLIDARNMPKASAFVQGGYGRPGLNMLSSDFDPFYIAGLRLNWPLAGLYNAKRDKKLATISRQKIELQKESFVLNTLSTLKQQRAEVKRYEELVSSDQAIVEIRNKIMEAAKAQLENAVITANDYLREVNAVDQARQATTLHKLQLTQAQINYQIASGKL
jgi:outer membrane protein TolC